MVIGCVVLRCRALVFVVKFFDGVVPAPSDKGAQAVIELGAAVAAKVQDYIAAMEKVRACLCVWWLWLKGLAQSACIWLMEWRC